MKRTLILLIFLLLTACANKTTQVAEEDVKVLEKPSIDEEVMKKEPIIDEVEEEPAFEVKVEVKALPTTWHYQLQNTDFNNLKSLDVEVLVIDVDDSEFTKEQIKTLKEDKIVLSYLSIGEAEDYRSYWNDDWEIGNPKFLFEENPNWKGNYKVRYWDEEWQDIILTKLTEIENLGYDGVYLDIIDAYEYFEDIEDADDKMVSFVKKISEHTNKDFMTITQNAPELYTRYSDYISGVGQEDTWFYDEEFQDEELRDFTWDILEEVKNDGKLVLSIDYPTAEIRVCEYYDICRQYGYACTVSNRDLDLNSQVECDLL